ncbi:MAG: YvcK family protein, partial [Lachnospiraceae bacterium]|nr:YvcK family protein [Lachnospiraceae bacterium]
MKKVVVFGGGTGLSCLLSGLKLFPIDVTTVIAVSDNGSSTGVLKEELDIPAVGDVGKVLLAMANVDDDFVKLLRYRFSKDGSLHNHPVRNIILAALIDLQGNLTDATRYMCRLLNVKGTVLPLTEEKVDLVGVSDSREYFGEEEVSQNIRNIRRLRYDHDITVRQEIIDRILDADLIIFSPGSLYTSILPHLIAPAVRDALAATKAPLMYVSNLVTQPGETDGYQVSQHIGVLNRYLKDRKIDVVIANTADIDQRIIT